MADHRHSWFGQMRSCGKAHRGLDPKVYVCRHWVCEKCDALDPRNYSTQRMGIDRQTGQRVLMSDPANPSLRDYR